MQYITFSENPPAAFTSAILVPELHADRMRTEYFERPTDALLNPDEVVAYKLHKTGKKTAVATQKEFLDELLPTLYELGVEYLFVGDAEYFKTIAGVGKADPYMGYVLPSKYPEQAEGAFQVIYMPNYRQVFHNPGPTREKINRALVAYEDHRQGAYTEPGHGLLQTFRTPVTDAEIEAELLWLLDLDQPLAIDIEAFSLKHHEAGLGTISFAWSENEATAFCIDYVPLDEPVKDGRSGTIYGERIYNAHRRKMLRRFFELLLQKQLYHNISYDVMVLIYELFMDDLLDQKGMLTGLEVMLRNWDDTKLITYLATNSCAGNKLGLKDQAQEFAGNYAVDEIKDILKLPVDKLLEYNAVDACSTWFVRNKHWGTMVQDEQLEIYDTLFKPAIVDIIQMQLTGMPLDPDRVQQVKRLFMADRQDALDVVLAHSAVSHFTHILRVEAVEEYNATHKRTSRTLADFTDLHFNPNSSPQLQRLFYEILELPVIERTDSKLPATSAGVLEKLKAYTDDESIKELINAYLAYAKVDKLMGTFIPPMEEAPVASDGCAYLFGNFNLGGTKSGRLSSSGPNLQTIPAKGPYAKLIKSCFVAPKGHVMIGLDFASLEDRISALTTKDPQKLKVYDDGYDGHCLRAYSYFGDQMPDIDPTSVDSINSIAKKYKELRNDSKGPTFLLTYDGTWIGMVAQFNFSPEKAKSIEKAYHDLYRVSDEWKEERLKQACSDGYVTVAFGLRLRTPMLSQVILNNGSTPWEASAEARTAGNALGQSWCLLNTRASIEFMLKVREHPRYRYLIRPIAHIHDAQYFIIPDDPELLAWVNKHLVEAVYWQDHPEIAHPDVCLGGELSLFYPSWKDEIVLPNHANANELMEVIAEELEKREKKAA